ncbi:MAG: hypothetical protein ACPHID_02885 [Thermoplasmatota archaeon]
MEPLFLEATFRAQGLVFARFSNVPDCLHADLRAEQIDASGLRGRYAVHGISAERARQLEEALMRRYGEVNHTAYHEESRTATGRIFMDGEPLRQVVAGALMQVADRFGAPWLRFEQGITTLRAPVLVDVSPEILANLVQGILEPYDPEAKVRVGPLEGRIATVWKAIVANDANSEALSPASPVA